MPPHFPQAFPPLHTPSGFNQRDLIQEGRWGQQGQQEERSGPSIALLVVVFLLSVGVGLGATYVVAMQL